MDSKEVIGVVFGIMFSVFFILVYTGIYDEIFGEVKPIANDLDMLTDTSKNRINLLIDTERPQELNPTLWIESILFIVFFGLISSIIYGSYQAKTMTTRNFITSLFIGSAALIIIMEEYLSSILQQFVNIYIIGWLEYNSYVLNYIAINSTMLIWILFVLSICVNYSKKYIFSVEES